MSTILIIEDEKPISDIIKFNRQKEGFDILTVYDGKEGLEMALSANPEIIHVGDHYYHMADQGKE